MPLCRGHSRPLPSAGLPVDTGSRGQWGGVLARSGGQLRGAESSRASGGCPLRWLGNGTQVTPPPVSCKFSLETPGSSGKGVSTAALLGTRPCPLQEPKLDPARVIQARWRAGRKAGRDPAADEFTAVLCVRALCGGGGMRPRETDGQTDGTDSGVSSPASLKPRRSVLCPVHLAACSASVGRNGKEPPPGLQGAVLGLVCSGAWRRSGARGP